MHREQLTPEPEGQPTAADIARYLKAIGAARRALGEQLRQQLVTKGNGRPWEAMHEMSQSLPPDDLRQGEQN